MDIAVLLVEAGSFINLQTPSHGFTALMNAVWHRHSEMVEYLLGLDAIDVEIVSAIGAKARDFIGEIRSPDSSLGMAEATTQYREAGVFDGLFEAYETRRRERLDQNNLLAIVTDDSLSDDARVARIQELLENTGEVDARFPVMYQGNDYYTPLLAAAREGQHRVVELLLDRSTQYAVTCWPTPRTRLVTRVTLG